MTKRLLASALALAVAGGIGAPAAYANSPNDSRARVLLNAENPFIVGFAAEEAGVPHEQMVVGMPVQPISSIGLKDAWGLVPDRISAPVGTITLLSLTSTDLRRAWAIDLVHTFPDRRDGSVRALASNDLDHAWVLNVPPIVTDQGSSPVAPLSSTDLDDAWTADLARARGTNVQARNGEDVPAPSVPSRDFGDPWAPSIVNKLISAENVALMSETELSATVTNVGEVATVPAGAVSLGVGSTTADSGDSAQNLGQQMRAVGLFGNSLSSGLGGAQQSGNTLSTDIPEPATLEAITKLLGGVSAP